MKNLIIGSEGYIGSHLQKVIQADTLDIKGNPKFKIDITKKINLKKEYDNVIILAALVQVGESEKKPYEYYKTNIFGLINILENIKSKHFIFASSGAAQNPTSVYANTKKIGEEIVKNFCEKNNISYTIFRFYNVIGSSFGIKPTNQDGLFYNLVQAIETKKISIYGNCYNTKDGTAIRDYIHVLDVCSSIAKSLEKPSNSTESLGTGVGYTVLEIVNTFRKVNKLEFEISFLPERSGDQEKSILKNVSNYFKQTFTVEELLKIKESELWKD